MSGARADGSVPPSRRRWVRITVAVVCGVALLAVGVLAGWFGGRAAAGGTTSTGARGPSACDAVTVARDVLPSVVTVAVSSPSGGGSGSGEVIDRSGLVLTNDHVVSAGGGETVSVRLDDGSELPAEIVGRDPVTDLAVLRARTDRDLPALRWGSSDAVVVGQPVVAIGAPLGLSGTVTTGVVSALGRDVPVPTETGSTVLTGAIQTDASINPGNSGGALVTCDGRLVGINTAIATVPGENGASSGSVGIGFAVPSTVARPVADVLRDGGTVAHPDFGAETAPVALRSSAGSTALGLQITALTSGGAADAAGLRVGDVLTDIEGIGPLHADTLAHVSATARAGDRLDVTYLRSGDRHTTTVRLRAHGR